MNKEMKQEFSLKADAILEHTDRVSRKKLKRMMKRAYKVNLSLNYQIDTGLWDLSNNDGLIIFDSDMWIHIESAVSMIEMN